MTWQDHYVRKWHFCRTGNGDNSQQRSISYLNVPILPLFATTVPISFSLLSFIIQSILSFENVQFSWYAWQSEEWSTFLAICWTYCARGGKRRIKVLSILWFVLVNDARHGAQQLSLLRRLFAGKPSRCIHLDSIWRIDHTDHQQ